MKKPCDCQCHCEEPSPTWTEDELCPAVTGDNSVHNWQTRKPNGCFTILLTGEAGYPATMDFCTTQSSSDIQVRLKNPERGSFGLCGADMDYCSFPDSIAPGEESKHLFLKMFAHDAVIPYEEPTGVLSFVNDLPKPYWYGTVPFLDDTLHLKLYCDPCSGEVNNYDNGQLLKIWWESGCSAERILRPWMARTWYEQVWNRAYTVCIGLDCENFGCRDCALIGQNYTRLPCNNLPDTYKITVEFDTPVECEESTWGGYPNECWRCFGLEGEHLLHTETEHFVQWYGDGITPEITDDEYTRIHGNKCNWIGFIDPPNETILDAMDRYLAGLPYWLQYINRKPIFLLTMVHQYELVEVYVNPYSSAPVNGNWASYTCTWEELNCYGVTELTLRSSNGFPCQFPSRILLEPVPYVPPVPFMAMSGEPEVPEEAQEQSPEVPTVERKNEAKKRRGCNCGRKKARTKAEIDRAMGRG